MEEKTIRCTSCSAEFTDEELRGASSCPKCGTTGVPCLIKEDITLRINWHELRILCMWADNYARWNLELDSKKTLAIIISRLRAQYPENSPLTLFGEVESLRNSGFDADLVDADGNLLMPKSNRGKS